MTPVAQRLFIRYERRSLLVSFPASPKVRELGESADIKREGGSRIGGTHMRRGGGGGDSDRNCDTYYGWMGLVKDPPGAEEALALGATSGV